MHNTGDTRDRRTDPSYLAERQQFFQDLRKRLRVLRLHLNLTEHEMAARLEISVRAYRYRERQATSMSSVFAVQLSEEFNVSIDWLSFGTKGRLPRNDHRPLTPDMRAIPPRLRMVAPPAGRSVA